MPICSLRSTQILLQQHDTGKRNVNQETVWRVIRLLDYKNGRRILNVRNGDMLTVFARSQSILELVYVGDRTGLNISNIFVNYVIMKKQSHY